jgi:hypothetical protein
MIGARARPGLAGPGQIEPSGRPPWVAGVRSSEASFRSGGRRDRAARRRRRRRPAIDVVLLLPAAGLGSWRRCPWRRVASPGSFVPRRARL